MSNIRVSLLGNKNSLANADFIKQLYDDLHKMSMHIQMDSYIAEVLQQKPLSLRQLLHSDFIITLGGDGTILRLARHLQDQDTKVIGVNLGKVGFLTELNQSNYLPGIQKILQGDYSIDQRALLHIELYRQKKLIKSFLALNEVAINQGLKARIRKLQLKTGQKLIHNFEVDGLIISTPTGSTGHSLSAGGSIVSPNLEAFLITPICPLSLANRPLILADDRKLSITVSTKRDPDSPIGLTLDGQVSQSLKQNDKIVIQKSALQLNLIRTEPYNFFRHLRSKLKWGI